MTKHDAIVVLGSFVDRDMEARVERAIDLVNRQCSQYIVLVGTQREVSFMRDMAFNHGLLPEQITCDGNSRTTIDNAYYAKEKCSQVGAKNVVLVTSEYHSERAMMIFKAVFGNGFRIIKSIVADNNDDHSVIERERIMRKLSPFLSLFQQGDHQSIKNASDLVRKLTEGAFESPELPMTRAHHLIPSRVR